MTIHGILRLAGVAALAASTLLATATVRAETTLLNVSYDPTRELYDDYNKVSSSTGSRSPARTWRSASRMEAPASRRAR